MATLRIEIPDGINCEECSYLSKMDGMSDATNSCKIFDCSLGNKLTKIFKCPMCIEQSRQESNIYRKSSAYMGDK